MEIKNYGYEFYKDELMQNIGNSLFEEDSSISISRNTEGETIISFLVYENSIYVTSQELNTPRKCKIIIYPLFDDMNDYYNIIILISTYSKYENRSFEIIVPGNEPAEQNSFLSEIIKDDIIKEIWVKDIRKGFINCISPIYDIDITRKELLKKIISWNKREIKACKNCKKEISKDCQSDLCSDCLSRQAVLSNHKAI